MRRLVLHLAIAGLTYLVGCFIAASYRFVMTSDESPPVQENEVTNIDTTSQPKVRIFNGMHACGPTANFHSYVASDGANLSSSCFKMASEEQAKQEVKTRLRYARGIIERHEERNEDGFVVRQRIVLVNAGGVASLAVSGKSFCETKAPTLKHLQALERR